MDNTLAFIDQGSFLSLRALGRGPLIQFTWIYDRPLDLAGVRRFHANLGHGPLGRRIERSPLPFGRDHWVTAPAPSDLAVAALDLPRDEVWTWAYARLRVPVDPRWGPSWHLGVQPLIGGGAAVSLVVSHSVADAALIKLAITDAAQGVRTDLGYPAPGYRTRRRALVEDARRAIRDLPEMARAVTSAVRIARAESEGLATSFESGGKTRAGGTDDAVVVPNCTAFFDLAHWDERARSLGGTSNSLFAAVSARLGQLIGRIDADGRVRLSLPVSERTAGDTRANALTEVSVRVDPGEVTHDLSALRGDLKQKLSALADTPNELLGPLALVPLTPSLLVRRLEGMVQQLGNPIGCSNIGEFTADMNRPDGTEADYFTVRMIEPHVTQKLLNQKGGLLFVGCGRVRGRVFLTVVGWRVDGPNTHDALADAVRRAASDLGLTGTVEWPQTSVTT